MFFADSASYGVRWLAGSFADNVTEQINVTENVSLTARTHQFKFGLDYRRLHSTAAFKAATWTYGFLSLANVLANSVPQASVVAYTPNTQLAIPNWSLFAQDTWKPARNLTVTYGVRWEYNGAPSSPNGTLPFTVIGIDNPRTMTLAPQGTPLWEATKRNFAPRLGVAWLPMPNLVVRAGAGIFYDLGYSGVASGISTWPYQRIEGRSQHDVSNEHRRSDAASLLHGSPGGIYGRNGSEPRVAEDVPMERGDRAEFGKRDFDDGNLPRSGGPQADAERLLLFAESQFLGGSLTS